MTAITKADLDKITEAITKFDEKYDIRHENIQVHLLKMKETIYESGARVHKRIDEVKDVVYKAIENQATMTGRLNGIDKRLEDVDGSLDDIDNVLESIENGNGKKKNGKNGLFSKLKEVPLFAWVILAGILANFGIDISEYLPPLNGGK